MSEKWIRGGVSKEGYSPENSLTTEKRADSHENGIIQQVLHPVQDGRPRGIPADIGKNLSPIDILKESEKCPKK